MPANGALETQAGRQLEAFDSQEGIHEAARNRCKQRFYIVFKATRNLLGSPLCSVRGG